MHELSVCRQLIRQLEQLGQKHAATNITRVCLSVGALSGIEPSLIRVAFPMVAAGTLAEHAELEVTFQPVVIRCLECANESSATPNNLCCPECQSNQTTLIAGDAMMLTRFSMNKQEKQHV